MNWPLCIAHHSQRMSSLTSLLMVTLWNLKVLCSGSAWLSGGSHQLFSGPFVQRCSDGIRSLLHLVTSIGYPSKAISSFLTLIMTDRTTFRSRVISLSICCTFKAKITAHLLICWVNLIPDIIYLKREGNKKKERLKDVSDVRCILIIGI